MDGQMWFNEALFETPTLLTQGSVNTRTEKKEQVRNEGTSGREERQREGRTKNDT